MKYYITYTYPLYPDTTPQKDSNCIREFGLYTINNCELEFSKPISSIMEVLEEVKRFHKEHWKVDLPPTAIVTAFCVFD